MEANQGSRRRERHPIPEDVRAALDGESLWDAYRERPAYQQNDYVGWISGAKRPETREKRLRQMLNELGSGGVYMKMKHRPSHPDVQSQMGSQPSTPGT